MKANRNYAGFEYLEKAAATIVSECITDGSSSGWSGSEKDFAIVEEICNRFGVVYTDDFHGEWSPKKA